MTSPKGPGEPPQKPTVLRSPREVQQTGRFRGWTAVCANEGRVRARLLAVVVVTMLAVAASTTTSRAATGGVDTTYGGGGVGTGNFNDAAPSTGRCSRTLTATHSKSRRRRGTSPAPDRRRHHGPATHISGHSVTRRWTARAASWWLVGTRSTTTCGSSAGPTWGLIRRSAVR